MRRLARRVRRGDVYGNQQSKRTNRCDKTRHISLPDTIFFRAVEPPIDELNLFFHEFKDFLEELVAVLLEKNEMRGILDQDVALRRRVYECTHQAFTVLLKRPGIEISADHQGRYIDICRIP